MSHNPGPLHREDEKRRLLYQLCSARSDVRAATQICTYARDHVTDIRDELWLPLQDALIVSYARPFTRNRPVGPLPDQWARFEDPEHQRLHDELVSMRHEIVAHGDAARRTVVIFPPGTIPPIGGGPPTSEATVSVAQARKDPSYFAKVEGLCQDLQARLHVETEALLQELFGDIDAREPFDLMTGEVVQSGPWGGTVIARGKMPKP